MCHVPVTSPVNPKQFMTVAAYAVIPRLAVIPVTVILFQFLPGVCNGSFSCFFFIFDVFSRKKKCRILDMYLPVCVQAIVYQTTDILS